MTEFGAGPLWVSYPSDPFVNPAEAGEVPLSSDLAADLDAWYEEYQATYDPSYPPDSAFPSEEAEQAWVARGEELSRRVAAELPGARVHYARYGKPDLQVR
ncbi:MAG: hypothetical protein ACFCVF_09760 [Kineosporiaceae bacterium]